ncbi:MAG TPA: hypothetical protein VF456_25845 [Vicinamibacterales bacterium]
MLVILGTGALWGAVWFAVGFFGPMFLGGGNQGPLLGIIITGPLGFLVGCVIGAYRVVTRAKRPDRGSTPGAALTGWQLSGLAIIAGFLMQFLGSAAIISVMRYGGFSSAAILAVYPAAGVAAGYIVAHIAPRAGLAHGAALAAIQLSLTVFGSFGRRDPVAARSVLISGALLSLAILVGAYIQTRWSRRETIAAIR